MGHLISSTLEKCGVAYRNIINFQDRLWWFGYVYGNTGNNHDATNLSIHKEEEGTPTQFPI